MNTPLITTKLYIPKPPQNIVSRPELLKRLSAALTGKLTLISAPTGYGKTTLMTEWCAGPGEDTPLAWFSLDEGDNDPVGFLAYLIAALQNIQDDLGMDIEVLLQGSQNPPFPAILSILINELAAVPRDCVLVLEDYHLIEKREIHQMLIFLLDHLPPQVHIAILTRADPPMPLGRLRAHGQISEIRLNELRFTLDETRRFFQDVMALNIQPKEMEILLSRTEGWVAGLQLAALSIQGQVDPSDAIQAFGSGHDYIVDYLIEEVLNRQTEARRAFLLQTSILSRLNGPLCDALTGQTGCENTLESLERANLFVSRLGGEDRWYRYHRLFASVMSNRLQRRYPDQIPELNLRAAKWYVQNNLIPQAIDHALTAEDYPYAASLISSIALEVLSAGGISTLLAWFSKFPDNMIQDDPRFYLYWAWALLLSGRTVPIESTITIAEQRANSLDMFDELRGDIAAVMAYEASRRGDMKLGFEKAHEALEWLAEDNYSVRSVMAFVLGGIYYMRQDWPRAIAAMKEAGRLGEISKNFNVAVSALSAMGKMQLSQGELTGADKTFTHALDLSKGRSGQPLPIASSAYSGLAKLNLMRRNLEEARQLAQKGIELAEQWINVDSQVGCLLTLAQINHVEGNPDEAQLALEEAKWLAGKHVLTPDAPESIAEIEALLQTKPSRDSSGGPLIDPLSKREQEVLSLFAQGLTNKEVAERLFISLGTVKAHSSHIYQKLNARSRTDVVLKARQLGLL